MMDYYAIGMILLLAGILSIPFIRDDLRRRKKR